MSVHPYGSRQARAAAAEAIIRRSVRFGDAIAECARHGVADTQNALYNLFKDTGRSAPSTYLGTALVVPERAFVDTRPEPDDGPPTLRGGFEPAPDASHSLERILFIPDAHFPFVDRLAWDVMRRAARMFRPDVVVILGDFWDCYAVSAHDKNPSRLTSLEAEAESVREALDEVLDLGAKRVCYVEGNHEWRLPRYIAKQAAALHGLLTVPALLGLAERGIEWTPYMHSLRIGHLTVTHDVGEAGIYAVKRARDAAEGNIVIGHVHAMGIHYSGSARGVVRVGAAFGWLGHSETAGDYIHAVKKARNWTHGFGIGHMQADGTVHLQAIPIIGGSCVIPTEARLVL